MHFHGLRLLFILVCVATSLVGCQAQTPPAPVAAAPEVVDTVQWHLYDTGMATYYSARTHGRMMASGERYHKSELFCAHRSLPIGTRLRIVNKKNGKEVEVVVKDRGPFSKGRLVDLSNKAAEMLGMIRDGVAPVEIWIEGKEESAEEPKKE